MVQYVGYRLKKNFLSIQNFCIYYINIQYVIRLEYRYVDNVSVMDTFIQCHTVDIIIYVLHIIIKVNSLYSERFIFSKIISWPHIIDA